MPKRPQESLLESERLTLSPRSGGGLLSYEVWGRHAGGRRVVTRYSVAYINHAIFSGDNGRVLGFDNAHGVHHWHLMGEVEQVAFISYEATLRRFQDEWTQIVRKRRGKRS